MQYQSLEDTYIDQMEWEKQLLNPELDEPATEATRQSRTITPNTDVIPAKAAIRRSKRAILYDLIDEGGWKIAGYPIED
ncbi:MAG: hypothetical protein GX604_02850 [Actinobacteria bacterium]|nr:hypothetical protein [Actinomycetota bacterium]